MRELALHIMDILNNSVRARADLIEFEITESREKNLYRMIFKDNGKGMDEELLTQVLNPWVTSRTKRKVGMGLSLLKQNAELAGGSLTIESDAQPGDRQGTLVGVIFEHDHLDRPIAGDIPGSMVIMASSSPEIEFIYTHITDTGSYTFDTREIKDVLGGVAMNNIAIINGLKEMILENLNDINAETITTQDRIQL